MKRIAYLSATCLLATSLVTLTSCRDDDNLMTNDVTEAAADNNSVDPQICGILSLLEGTPGYNVTTGTFSQSAKASSAAEHNIHYLNNATSVDAAKAAYANGDFFIVPQRSAKAISRAVGHNLSIDFAQGSEFELAQAPQTEFGTKDQLPGTNATTTVSGSKPEMRVEVPASARFLLFNKNVEMVVAVPFSGEQTQTLVQAIKDAVEKYQTKAPVSRADCGVNLLVSEPKLFTWTANYTCTANGKVISTNSQTITASYIVSSCYSYNSDRDYYMLQQEVTFYNSQLATRKSRVSKLYDGDDYLVYAGFAHGAFLKATLGANNFYELGAADNNKYHLIQSSPATTTGSTSVSTGISFNVGGNIGLSMSGPSMGLSTGASFSESRSMSIPDVSVKNVCGSAADGKMNDARYAEWQFEIAWPNGDSDYLNTKDCRWQIDDVAGIGKTTATFISSHLWAVDHPASGFRPIIGVGVESMVGWKAGHQTWLGEWDQYWGYTRSCQWYTINLEPLKRD